MLQKQTRRSEQEWMKLIQECRGSGLSDRAWCSEHDIPISTFYNRISYFRKKACDIPSPARSAVQPSQQVVALSVVEDTGIPADSCVTQETGAFSCLPAVTLTIKGCRLEINNHAGKDTIRNTLIALQQLC